MKSIIKKTVLTLMVIALYGAMYAQTRTVIWDNVNQIPVSYANVYKIENGAVKGTISDNNGICNVDFPFKELTISHINYETSTTSKIGDTLFLTPKSYILQEIKISSKEPEWIRPFLKKLVQKNSDVNKVISTTFDYDYMTRCINSESGYWFESQGLLLDAPKKNYSVSPSTAKIHFKDNTAGCDFTCMRRILYEDFMRTLTKKFIKSHTFSEIDIPDNDNPNIVQIGFESLKYGDGDCGYMRVDTAHYTIHLVHRETKLDYNIHNYVDGFARSTIHSIMGYDFKTWTIATDITYNNTNGLCYATNAKYKIFYVIESSKGNFSGKKFESKEAELNLKPAISEKHTSEFIELPPFQLMQIIQTKSEREKEESLQNIDKEYILY